MRYSSYSDAVIVLYDRILIRRCTYHTPLWGGFPTSIPRQPRGCQFRTIRLRKALGENFPPPTFLAGTISPTTTAVEMSTMEVRPMGDVKYTVVYVSTFFPPLRHAFELQRGPYCITIPTVVLTIRLYPVVGCAWLVWKPVC